MKRCPQFPNCETTQHPCTCHKDHLPRPKTQRVRFDDAMAMIRKTAKHKFRKRFPGHNPPDNVDCITFLNRSEIEHIIKKLTR